MARSHGRISSAIWRDEDFVALDPEAQRLYLFLLSQPDLTHAGLIPLRTRSWSTRFAGGTPDRVRTALKVLEQTRFVLVDEDTEELLVRTFVRNDGVYKQPKVMERMAVDASQIMSLRLRAAFCVELRRLPYEELTGHQLATAERVRDELLTLFGQPNHTPPNPSGTLPDTHGDTHGEGLAIPPRAGTRSPRPPSPVPQPPTPVPQTTQLALVCRRLSGDAQATTTDDGLISSWQQLAGTADLELEARIWLDHNADKRLRDPAAAWRGWLRKAAKREAAETPTAAAHPEDEPVAHRPQPPCVLCDDSGWRGEDERGRAIKCHCRSEIARVIPITDAVGAAS